MGGVTMSSTSSVDATNPDIAYGDGGFLVAWEEGGDVKARRTNASFSTSSAITIANTTASENAPAVAYSGSSFMIAYQEGSSGNKNVRAKRVSSTPAVLDSTPIPVSSATSDQALPDIACAGTSCLVTWEDYRNSSTTGADIYGALVPQSGSSTEPTAIAINTQGGAQARPAVAADGSEYLVLWEDARSGTSDVYGSFVSTSGTVSSSSGFSLASTDVAESSVAVASGQAQKFLVGYVSPYVDASTSVDRVRLRLVTDDDPDHDGYTAAGGDCNTTDPAVHPGATEVAGDGNDQNCDGHELCFTDADDDGYRPDTTSTVASIDTDCGDTSEATSADPTTDCNDSSSTIHPGASESCDLVDSDCDSDLVDGFTNPDSDARPSCVDNCPSTANDNQQDVDGDGAGDACDNCPALSNTSQTNSDGDAFGDDCDNCPTMSNSSQADSDGDNYGDACESTLAALDPNTHPGAMELCDALDNDGDGLVDEGTSCERCAQ